MQGAGGQQQPDPHGYGAEGTRRMWRYLYRQLWVLRYLTLALVALMSWYTIHFQAWIPFLNANVVSILIWMMWWWMGISTLKKLCIGAVQMEKTNHANLQKVYSNIGKVTWLQWGLSVVGTYWAVIIFYISYFAPEG